MITFRKLLSLLLVYALLFNSVAYGLVPAPSKPPLSKGGSSLVIPPSEWNYTKLQGGLQATQIGAYRLTYDTRGLLTNTAGHNYSSDRVMDTGLGDLTSEQISINSGVVYSINILSMDNLRRITSKEEVVGGASTKEDANILSKSQNITIKYNLMVDYGLPR